MAPNDGGSICHVCYFPPSECKCALSLKVPPDVAAPKEKKVTPIRPQVKVADQTHVDLRFDPGYPTDTMLAKAAAADLKGVLLVGYHPDGSVYIDCNINDGPLALWAIENAKALLTKGMTE